MENNQNENIDEDKNQNVDVYKTPSYIIAINEKIAKAKDFIIKHPKQVFITMVILTVLSLISNFLYYEYTIKNAKISYKEMSAQIFDKAGESKQKQNANPKEKESIAKQATNYFQMKKDLDRLKAYESKKVLSAQDSADIKAIVNIYNLE